jgi:hypothetical protein
MTMGRVVRTRGEARIHDAYAAGGRLATEAVGVMSRALLDAVSGGQPLEQLRRRRPWQATRGTPSAGSSTQPSRCSAASTSPAFGIPHPLPVHGS